MESFTADLWRFSSTNVKIRFLGGRLGNHRQIQAFQGFSFFFFLSCVGTQARPSAKMPRAYTVNIHNSKN